MKAVLTTGCWGRSYIDSLISVSAASLLSPGNIPGLTAGDSVVWQLISPRKDLERFRASPVAVALERLCETDYVAVEDHFSAAYDQVGADSFVKYDLVTQMQNYALRSSNNADFISFNYADCVWQDGNLPFLFQRMARGDVDALLSFGPPLNAAAGRAALDAFRDESQLHRPITLAPRDCARLICNNLHPDTRLRFWEGSEFTAAPSYLLWSVPDAGLLVRSCHQTLAALRVRPDDPIYTAGINRGTLDGDFSGAITAHWRYEIIKEATDFALFTLHDLDVRTTMDPNLTRDFVLKTTLMAAAPSQRRLVFTPIRFVFDDAAPAVWRSVVECSAAVYHRMLISEPTQSQKPQIWLGQILAILQRWRRTGRRLPGLRRLQTSQNTTSISQSGITHTEAAHPLRRYWRALRITFRQRLFAVARLGM